MKLPDLPSELLSLALKDLEKTEQNPKYVIDMRAWHHPNQFHCHVCLAGAVIAQTLQSDSFYKVWPDDFSIDTEKKLKALNYLRMGQIHSAASLLPVLDGFKPPLRFSITPYSFGKELFKKDIRELIEELKKAGL